LSLLVMVPVSHSSSIEHEQSFLKIMFVLFVLLVIPVVRGEYCHRQN
jgi:hypothetical protein